MRSNRCLRCDTRPAQLLLSELCVPCETEAVDEFFATEELERTPDERALA